MTPTMWAELIGFVFLMAAFLVERRFSKREYERAVAEYDKALAIHAEVSEMLAEMRNMRTQGE